MIVGDYDDMYVSVLVGCDGFVNVWVYWVFECD